jgi:hypothetical protein
MTDQEKHIILSEMRQEIQERSTQIDEIIDHLSVSIPALEKSMKQLKKELTERLKS